MLAKEMMERLTIALDTLTHLTPEDVRINELSLIATAEREGIEGAGRTVIGLDMGGNLAAADALLETLETMLKAASVEAVVTKFEGRRMSDPSSIYTITTPKYRIRLSEFSHYLNNMVKTTPPATMMDNNGVDYDPGTITEDQKANLEQYGTLTCPGPDTEHD